MALGLRLFWPDLERLHPLKASAVASLVIVGWLMILAIVFVR
jgi:hypothetical protein